MESSDTGLVEIENFMSDTYSSVRSWLLPIMMECLSKNKHAEYPQKIFEIGKVFDLDKSSYEREHLAVAITPGNFTELKQSLEYFFKLINRKIKIASINIYSNFFHIIIDHRICNRSYGVY
mgnify:CR=1 FL=1